MRTAFPGQLSGRVLCQRSTAPTGPPPADDPAGPRRHRPIDCEACVPECPVEAIFSEANTPPQWTSYVQLNAEKSAALKESGHITEKQPPKEGPECQKK